MIEKIPLTLRHIFPFCLCLLFIMCGIIRITAGYPIFTQTNDEQAHLAAGMQMLDIHRYDYDTINTPLARLMIATLPYLSGLSPSKEEYTKYSDTLGMWKIGNIILYKNHQYFHNLTLARLGILPFYVIAILTLWAWGKRFYNTTVALTSTLLFSAMPVILGHSMLATTDMAITAMLALALFTALVWMQSPSSKHSLALGITAGLALLSKMSALIFLPLCIKVLLFYKDYSSTNPILLTRSQKLITGALIAASLSVTVWAGYFFINFPSYLGFERLIDGFDALLFKQTHGDMLFFNGETNTPHWYYFPVLLALKTPIAFSILTIIGIFAFIRGPLREKNWLQAAPLLFVGILLVITAASRINMGIRHILAIYPFLCILAGYGTFWLLENTNRYVKTIPLLLLLWYAGTSLLAHPYYLGYFNELVKNPETLTLDSDQDWGQDLYLLTQELNKRNISLDYLYYLGWARPEYFGLPANQCNLPSGMAQPTPDKKGYYAISLTCLLVTNVAELSWLKHYTPVAKIGTSILLYYIP